MQGPAAAAAAADGAAAPAEQQDDKENKKKDKKKDRKAAGPSLGKGSAVVRAHLEKAVAAAAGGTAEALQVRGGRAVCVTSASVRTC